MKFFCILIIVVISGCSIQKRHYQPGWDVQWHKKKQSIGKDEVNKSIITETNELIVSESIGSENDLRYEFEFQKDSILKSKNTSLSLIKSDKIDRNQLGSIVQTLKKIPANLDVKEKVLSQSIRKVKKSVMSYNKFFLIMMIPIILMLAGGICALIFGQNWFWIVFGIAVIILSVLMLLLVLGMKATGRELGKGAKSMIFDKKKQ